MSTHLFNLVFFYVFFLQDHLHLFVTPNLLMWAMKPSPACLAWPVMGGGTVQGWLFPALPFHSLQDWASSWTQSRVSIKDLAARQVFKLYYKNIKLAGIFLCAFGRFLLLNFKDNIFLLPPSGEIRFLSSLPLSFPSLLVSCCQNLWLVTCAVAFRPCRPWFSAEPGSSVTNTISSTCYFGWLTN